MNQIQSFAAKQEAKDKRMIDRGIFESHEHVKKGEFEAASQTLSKISPASQRLRYKQYEISVLYSAICIKTGNFDEAKGHIQSAIRQKPEDSLSWRNLVQIEANNGTKESLKTAIHQAFLVCQVDGQLLTTIAPHLKDLDDQKLTDDFVKFLYIVPNGLDLPIWQYIPEIPSTVEVRKKMLERKEKNEACCIELIHLLIDEGDPFEAEKYSKSLPVDHQERIYVETLLGDDPVGSARKHVLNGATLFKDFLIAVDANDLQKMHNEINLIPSFVSGYLYLARQEKNVRQRILILSSALGKFPKYVPYLLLLAESKEEMGDFKGCENLIKDIINLDNDTGLSLYVHFLIRRGRCQEASNILSENKNLKISEKELADIELELYKNDNQDSHLEKIIELPSSKDVAQIKAESIYQLRNKIPDCEQLFLKILEFDENNGYIYYLYGKYIQELSKDEKKALSLFCKACSLGYVQDDISKDVVFHYLEQKDYEKCISILSKVDNNWSHFMLGLLYERQQDYEKSIVEFQHDLRYNKGRLESLSALGHSYFLLGRCFSAQGISNDLKEIGNPDLSLEFSISRVFGIPLNVRIQNSQVDSGNNTTPESRKVYEIDFQSDPIPFYSYLQQVIDNIRHLHNQNRIESAKSIGDSMCSSIREFSSKWPSLSSVQKICGDFFVEMFYLTQKSEYAATSFQCYKRRCELDRRAESFIDLSNSLYFLGKTNEAIGVLLRVVKVFKTHSGIWLSLGILYSKVNKYPFARHCFSVSYKLSSDIEKARVLSCCANIGILINDNELASQSINASRLHNPLDRDLWDIITYTSLISSTQKERSNQSSDNKEDTTSDNKVGLVNLHSSQRNVLDNAIIAFKNGVPIQNIKILPSLCLKKHKLLEALGFSFMLNDSGSISKSFEALGKYNFSLSYIENDDQRRELIKCLCGSSCVFSHAIQQYQNGNLLESAEEFSKKPDIYSQIASALCYLEIGKKDEALNVLSQFPQLASLPFVKLLLEYFLALKMHNLKSTQSKESIEFTKIPYYEQAFQLAQKYPELFFLNELQNNSRLKSSNRLIKRFPNDQKSLHIYLVSALKSLKLQTEFGENIINDNVLTKARQLYMAHQSFQTLAILTICLIQQKENAESLKNLQISCILRPNLIPKTKDLLLSLSNDQANSDQ